jgi:hypothetical protein
MNPSSIPLVSSCEPCYFMIKPTTYHHYSSETPLTSPILSPGETLCDPFHPLLSYRRPQANLNMAATNFFKLQTAAAHGQPITRPRSTPQQNVLHVTSDGSGSSDSSSSESSPPTVNHAWASNGIEAARCSRCHRTPSIDVRTGKANVVQFGLNSYYCTRCASMVGLLER